MPATEEATPQVGTVYCLFDPRNPRVPKYIGKTTMSLRRRLICHLCYHKQHPNHPVSVWVVELKGHSLVPTISALEIVSLEKLREREEHWIRFYKPLGSLLNKSYGDGMLGLHNKRSDLNIQITTPLLKECNERRKRPVVATDGREFPSVNDALRALGVSRNGFIDCMRSGWRCKGAHWSFKQSTIEQPCH